MANEVICIVDTDGTKNPDYTSLNDAVIGESGANPKCVTGPNLVSNDEQLTIECRSSNGAADTNPVDPGEILFTTDVEHFIKIVVPEGYRHKGIFEAEPTYYRLYITANSHCFRYLPSYTQIIGVVISNTENKRLLSDIGEHSLIDSCLFSTTSDGHLANVRLGHAQMVRNCIYRGPNRTGFHVSWLSANVLNCVASGPDIGFDFSGGTGEGGPVFKNCIAIKCKEAGFGGDQTEGITASNNISSDGTAPGESSLIDIDPDDIFVDHTNGDFRLRTGSPAINAGTDLSMYFEEDIIGINRPQGDCEIWDIGAFEFIVESNHIFFGTNF